MKCVVLDCGCRRSVSVWLQSIDFMLIALIYVSLMLSVVGECLGTNDIVVWSYSYTMTNTMTGTR